MEQPTTSELHEPAERHEVWQIIDMALKIRDSSIDAGEWVCNHLNLDPRMTLGELRRLVPYEQSWGGTHEERMAERSVVLEASFELLKVTDPHSPFVTGRPRLLEP